MVYKVLFRSIAGDVVVARFDSDKCKDAGELADQLVKLLHNDNNLQIPQEHAGDKYHTYIVSC